MNITEDMNNEYVGETYVDKDSDSNCYSMIFNMF